MDTESLRTNENCRPSANAVFNQYADMVYRLAFARTGNRYDSDDILQEVFLRYLRHEADMTDDAHRKAWLIRATINCSKSLLGSAWMRRTVGLKDDLYTEMKEHSEVYYAVLGLPRKYRTVIHLYYYENYSVAEIAQLCSSRPSTVKSWLYRARRQLEQKLKGEMPDVSSEISCG